jgi:predicted TIM-barrel fold metal-dependent hydrolase
MKMPGIIDVHAMLGQGHHLVLDPEELLRRMDRHGIHKAIARPLGAELAVANRAGNDRVLGAGGRVGALVSVNPWFGAAALDELKRCRDLGAVGLFLHPSRQGFLPTDAIAAPILDLAAAHRWPVMFHTGTYIHCDVLAVAEVARAYPETPFILGFGGYADMWFEIAGAMRDVANLWLETSATLGDGIRAVVQTAGAHRVLFGSGEPRNRYAVALGSLDRIGLSEPQLSAILSENARRLFNLL